MCPKHMRMSTPAHNLAPCHAISHHPQAIEQPRRIMAGLIIQHDALALRGGDCTDPTKEAIHPHHGRYRSALALLVGASV